MKNRKIIFYLVIFCVFLVNSLHGATVGGLNQKINELKRKNTELRKSLNKTKAEFNSSSNDEHIKKQIIANMVKEIARNNQQISYYESQLSEVNQNENTVIEGNNTESSSETEQPPEGTNSNSGLEEIEDQIKIEEARLQERVNNAIKVISEENYIRNQDVLILENLKKRFFSLPVGAEKEKIKNMIRIQQQEIFQCKQKILQTQNEIVNTYEHIANLYEAAEIVGDPVNITTGEFMAEYIDFVSVDFLDKFHVSRFYNQNGGNNSFGENWISSLDSRIIRCNFTDVNECIDKINDILGTIHSIITQCEKFELEFGYMVGEIRNIYDDCKNKRNYYEEELEYLNKMELTRQGLLHRNQYVTYGKYLKIENYYGYENQLIFIDEKGIEHFFMYENNGRWKEAIGELSKYKELRNLNKDGSYANNFDNTGGYELICKDGNKIIFDYFGIIKDKIDRNNNIISFQSYNGKINKIMMKTGEQIRIDWNNQNHISKISGPVSGEATFEYFNNKLKNVNDNKKIKIAYEYDELNNLIEIEKADSSKVIINYEYNPIKKKYVCGAVINENNCKEIFKYDFINNIITHDLYGEGNEIYYLDEYGNTKKYKDFRNNIIEIKKNNYGQIVSYKHNNIEKLFSYYDTGEIKNITYNNGETELYEYNNLGLITAFYDKDGNVNRFEYDENGNLLKTYIGNTCCGSYSYYENGLVKNYIENNIKYEILYDSFGNILEKRKFYDDGNVDISTWIYDENERPIKFSNTRGDCYNYEYGDFFKIEYHNKLKVRTDYNSRGYISKVTEEDINTGQKYIKENKYYNNGQLKQVFLDGNIFSEYEYYKNGILKSFTIWNNPKNKKLLGGLKTEYSYTDNWYLKSEYRSLIENGIELNKTLIKEYKYKKIGNKTSVILRERFKPSIENLFDEYGRIILKKSGNYNVIYKYKKSGRLEQVIDNRHNLCKFYYNKDGSYRKTFEKLNSGKIIYDFDAFGKLRKVKDNYGIEYNFIYDCYDNLVKEYGPNYSIKRDYDNKKRLISYCGKNRENKIVKEYSIQYDNKENQEISYVGTQLRYIKRYDSWNRVIETESVFGHLFYEYDYLGNRVQKEDLYGNKTKFDYSPVGSILEISYPNGDKENFEYDFQGNLIKKSRNNNIITEVEINEDFFKQKMFGAYKKVSFSENRKPIKIENYDTGIAIVNQGNGNDINYLYNDGKKYNFKFNETGKIIEEINPLGYKKSYIYDDKGMLNEYVNYSGQHIKYNFDIENNKSTVLYSSGNIAEIRKNYYGKIVDGKNNNFHYKYNYDLEGKLISQISEKTNSRIDYKYDSYGRCIEKKGNDFKFLYLYNRMGLISKVEDGLTNQWIKYQYDSLGRVKEQEHSNGIKVMVSYNSIGNMEYLICKNKIGIIIYADFILYDEYGRQTVKVDKNGQITKYKYDDAGRLIETIYPYSKDKEKFYLDEATECGYFIKDKPKLEKLNISITEIEQLYSIFSKVGNNSEIQIDLNDVYWRENYNYDENGNIICVENPYGKIIYNYDKLNRLESKNFNNTEKSGIKIKWNIDNNIEEIKSQRKRILFKYGDINRPVEIIVIDLFSGNKNICNYSYDCFGRKCVERSGNHIIEYIYEGITTTVVAKRNITEGDYIIPGLNQDDSTGINVKEIENIDKYKEKSNYRIVNEDKYKPHGIEIGSFNQSYSELEKSIDGKNYNILSYGGVPLIISTGNELMDTSFTLLNHNFEIQCLVNTNGDVVLDINSDTWGSKIKEEESRFIGQKNINSQFDFIIDCGTRDYIPLLKTFTSEDPIRDGNNWFAYCPCDPVNFSDTTGTRKELNTIRRSQYYRYCAYVSKYLAFDQNMYKEMGKCDVTIDGIHVDFDCADVAAAVNVFAKADADLLFENSVESLFYNHVINGRINESKSIFSSKNIMDSPSFYKVVDGFDDNILDYYENDKGHEDEYKAETKRLEQFLNNLKNPNCPIGPGDILIWKNSKIREEHEPEYCNHAAVIISVEKDRNNNIVGFYTLEGHIDGNKTELTYIRGDDIGKGDAISNYMGEFDGIYSSKQKLDNRDLFGCVK